MASRSPEGGLGDEAERVPLTRALVEPRLGVLGRNPFTQVHIFTTATISDLHLADLDALAEFPHLQVCSSKSRIES